MTSQHLGAALRPLHNSSFSLTSSSVKESLAKMIEVWVIPACDNDVPKHVDVVVCDRDSQDVTFIKQDADPAFLTV
jgi:hypothetical protein